MTPAYVALLAATAVAAVAAMAIAYTRSRDPFHPLLFACPITLFLYVYIPLSLARRGMLASYLPVDSLPAVQAVFLAMLCAFCGVLIGPITTVYYDSGFLVSLKGFVGAIIGGLASYPLAAAGAVFVGLIESFSSFWASAFKEVIVFTLIIPVLLWRSLTTHHHEDEE